MNLQMLAIVVEHADYIQLTTIRQRLLDEIATGHYDDSCIDALVITNIAIEKEMELFRKLW